MAESESATNKKTTEGKRSNERAEKKSFLEENKGGIIASAVAIVAVVLVAIFVPMMFGEVFDGDADDEMSSYSGYSYDGSSDDASFFDILSIPIAAANRSNRDTQRRNDYAMLSVAITSFSASNNGKINLLLPTNGSEYRVLDATKYVNADGLDPNGLTYKVMAIQCGATVNLSECGIPQPMDLQTSYGSEVYVVLNADCEGVDGNGYAIPTYNRSSRAFAIYGYLESGTYCTASQ